MRVIKNIEIDVQVKCIEARKAQVQLAETVGTTSQYVNRIIKKQDGVVNLCEKREQFGGIDMWLRLDIDGIIFHFQISGYRKSTEEWDSEWSREDLILQSKSWLDYQISNAELLLMCEVEELHAKIEALLTDNIVTVETMECIEPDLTFVFQPKYDLKNDPRYTYVTPGQEIVDISMELSIAFWNEGLTSNRLTMVFDRSDLEKILCYLEMVIGKKAENDETVQKLIAEGIIGVRF